MRKLAAVFVGLAMAAAADEPAAMFYEDVLRWRHMPYGMVMDPWTAWPGAEEITGYTRCGDSAMFTGLYVASQAYRYKVTRDPQARENLMEGLNGIRRLVEVTGTDVLARCAVPEYSPYLDGIMSEEQAHGIREGYDNGWKYYWVGNTSRDQYAGVFFGLTVAWNLVDEAEVQGWVSMLATRMLRRLQEDHWMVRMPEGEITTTFVGRPEQQLALLKLGRRANPKEFEGSYKALANLTGYGMAGPILLEVQEDHDSYYKFHIDHLSFYNLLTSGDNWWVRTGARNGFDILRKTTDDHQNALFDVIDTAINGNEFVRDERIKANLRAWLGRGDPKGWVDLSGQYGGCGERTDRTCGVIPVRERVPADFLWQRSPFQLAGGVWPEIESGGLDYTLVYWMARYHNVLRADEE